MSMQSRSRCKLTCRYLSEWLIGMKLKMELRYE